MILNKEQKEAALALDGPVLIVAGPGTGKTQLLSERAANIVKKGKALPENILIVTFTNAAARAMRERLASIMGHDGYSVGVETFHSFANSIVLESEDAINYVKDKIDMDDVEKIKALEYAFDNVNGAEPLKPFGFPYAHMVEIRSRISELKNEGIDPEEFRKKLKNISPGGEGEEEKKRMRRLGALALIYEKYEALKDSESALLFDDRGRKDYDDMILIAIEALSKEKGLRDTFRRQYKYIMVDEYQDTNGAQLSLLFHILHGSTPNLCCVGDDDQAIYRFQGATLSNFRILRERFPSLKTIVLKTNYRSAEEIVGLSSKIISQLPEDERIAVKKLNASIERKDKKIEFFEFLTEEEELSFIIGEVRRLAKKIKGEKPLNNIAILVRTRSQRQKVIEALLKADISYAADGSEDLRREKRVRQMLDVLDAANVSVLGNEKKSLALYRILSADYSRADHCDILKFIEFVNRRRFSARGENATAYKALNLFQEFQKWFPADIGKAPSKEDSRRLKINVELDLKNPNALHRAAWALKRALIDAGTKPVHDLLLGYIADTGLYSFLLKRYDKNKALKIRSLRTLVAFINRIKKSSLTRPSLRLNDFTAELDLREAHGMPLEGELATLSQDGVRVYTAHSAKGLEFYAVIMPFCLEQRSWPVRSKPDVVKLPPEIYRNKDRAREKERLKRLKFFDELRLFYVASTRAESVLIYTATPGEKVIISRFLTSLGLQPKSGSPEKEDKFLLDFLKGSSTERDPFKDTPGILRDMVKNMSMTPTKLNNYMECRRKFMFNSVLGLPGKKTPHLVFGNCAHKALEETYRYFMRSRKFPDFKFYKESFLRELEFQGTNDTIKKLCAERLETLADWYARESEDPVMPSALEADMAVRFPGGLLFKGKFDKIEKGKDGTVKIVDYKTGCPDKHVRAIHNCTDVFKYECDNYYRQLIAYKLVFDRNRRKKQNISASRGVLQFLEPASKTVKKYGLQKGAYHDIDIEITDEMVSGFEKLIKKCWEDIQALKFDKLPERDGKERCGRCDFDSICWGNEYGG